MSSSCSVRLSKERTRELSGEERCGASTWEWSRLRDGRCGTLLMVMHVSRGESVSLSPCPQPLCASHPVWFLLLNSSLQQWFRNSGFTKQPARVRGSRRPGLQTHEQEKPSPSIFLLLPPRRRHLKAPREAEGPSLATRRLPATRLSVSTLHLIPSREESPFPIPVASRTEQNQSLSRPPEDSQKVKATGVLAPSAAGVI